MFFIRSSVWIETDRKTFREREEKPKLMPRSLRGKYIEYNNNSFPFEPYFFLLITDLTHIYLLLSPTNRECDRLFALMHTQLAQPSDLTCLSVITYLGSLVEELK